MASWMERRRRDLETRRREEEERAAAAVRREVEEAVSAGLAGARDLPSGGAAAASGADGTASPLRDACLPGADPTRGGAPACVPACAGSPAPSAPPLPPGLAAPALPPASPAAPASPPPAAPPGSPLAASATPAPPAVAAVRAAAVAASPAPSGLHADVSAVRAAAVAASPAPSGLHASAAERLRLWVEQSSSEDEEDRELIRQIRRRVFEETEGMPEREREARARQIALEMAARLPARARQDRVAADVLSTLGGRLGPLDPLMRDPTVSEVLVNAPDEVWAERRGRLERQRLSFRGDREVRSLVEGIAAWAGRKFDWASPVLDCALADGSRLAAVRYPVAPRGTAVAIRKFPVMPTLEELKAAGGLPARDRAMSPGFLRQEAFPEDVDVADFLAWAIRRRVNLVFSGGTSSGKTTAANAAMELIDRGLRVVIIEDSLEMQPPPDLHVVRLERRPPNLEGQGEISLWGLLVASLRLRPDIIVVGECRKNETAVMLEAMTTGHPGSMTTVHADSPLDALRRMVRMVRQDMPETPAADLREYIASAVRLIVQLRRDAASPSGLRLVERVASVEGVDDAGQFVLGDLYRWRDGRLLPTGHVPGWAREAV